MAKGKDAPLNNDHLDALNKLIKLTTDTGEYLKKCTECGLNVDPEVRKNAEQQEIAVKLKRAFFPTAK